MRRRAGLSLLEIIIITAIAGIVLGIGALNFRKALVGQQEKDGVNAISRIVWQGTTLAASRNIEASLVKEGHVLKIVDEQDNVLKDVTLAESLSTNLGDGELLTFLPSGRTKDVNLPDPIQVSTQNDTYTLNISVIGDVRSSR